LTRRTSINRLQIGWIAGIIYFVLGFFEAGLDWARFEQDLPFYFPLIYTAIKVLVIVSFLFFMLGFVEVGRTYKNSILKISAYLMICSFAVIELYDIISIFSEITWEEFIMIKGGEAVAFGGVDLVFGIALLRLGKELGTSATLAGIFEIIVGVCFVTFILAFIGLFFLIPATIIEVILLYKCRDLLLAQQ